MDKAMKIPKITVLMPAYNAEAYLREAVESVLRQTFGDFELIIVNDGSRDRTAEIARSFADPRIIFVDHAENAGVIARLNEGLALARGEYVARIDADDLWADPEKLAKQAAFLDARPDCGLAGTLGTAIGPDGTALYPLDYPQSDGAIRRQMLVRNCFINCSVMFRKELLKKTGAYDPAEKHAEDYGLWLRLGTVSRLANLPDRSVSYRVTPEGDSLSNNERSIRNCIALIRKHRKDYPGFLAGMAKWSLKLLALKIVGAAGFSRIKRRLKK